MTENITAAIEDMQRTIERINADTRFTDDAKRNQIAGAYVRATDTVDTARAALEKAQEARVEALRRTVYGRLATPTGADIVADRDARERVARIETDNQEEALRLLSEAEFGHDTSLTRALLARAYDAGWIDVLNTYTATHPAAEKAVDELWELTSDRATLESVIRQEADLTVPVPSQLAGKTPIEIRELALNGTGIEEIVRNAVA